MAGIRIRHAVSRSTMVLVPVLSKPLTVTAADICPGCRSMFGADTVHPVKTVHLWLDDSGACIVSEGVLEELRQTGMPNLELDSEVAKPPDLTIGVPREKQDQEARALIVGRR